MEFSSYDDGFVSGSVNADGPASNHPTSHQHPDFDVARAFYASTLPKRVHDPALVYANFLLA